MLKVGSSNPNFRSFIVMTVGLRTENMPTRDSDFKLETLKGG